MTKQQALKKADRDGWKRAKLLPLESLTKPLQEYAREFQMEEAYFLGCLAGQRQSEALRLEQNEALIAILRQRLKNAR